ncbi:MAG: hypothetical protein ACFE7R_09495, partial [Candidatus Hodarchaeota archaeon]
GELLIQLSILTNLSPDELEEFKADIAKMRMSEQAAFVREVIMQEAIRAARRDGVSVEEVLEKLAAEAAMQVKGVEEVRKPTVLITEEEKPVVLVAEKEPEKPTPIAEEEVTPPPDVEIDEEIAPPPPTDRLSQFELAELRKELQNRGVPPHEIDTIMEQAKVLSRELVDELLRSLGVKE